jgi:hypothetical protein
MYTPEQLAAQIEEHQRFIAGIDGAERLDLTRANFDGANLYGALVDGALVEGHKITIAPVTVSALQYRVTIIDDRIIIGCQDHTVKAWAKFGDDAIARMDSGALDFWRVWKAPILAMAKSHRSRIKPVAKAKTDALVVAYCGEAERKAA